MGDKLKSHKDKSITKTSVCLPSSSSSTTLAKPEVINEPMSENIALDCAQNGDLVRLLKCFDDNADIYHEIIGNMINARSREDGKSPLEWASLLGREEMVAELLKRGAEVNSVNCKGYSALHLAAAWGKLDILKLLVRLGANLYLVTVNQETPHDIAKRYENDECADFLEWADCRQQLKNTILALKEQMAIPEKQKLLTKAERVSTNALINEKLEWLEKTTDALTADFITQRELFNENTNPITKKMNEPSPEKT